MAGTLEELHPFLEIHQTSPCPLINLKVGLVAVIVRLQLQSFLEFSSAFNVSFAAVASPILPVGLAV